MDILRKELNEIYLSQNLDDEYLDGKIIDDFRHSIQNMVEINNACSVITDASSDHCYVYAGAVANLIGWSEEGRLCCDIDSSDEDFIYNCLHPEDLPEKRLLEYEFFKYIDSLSGDDKLRFKATCRIRMRDRTGKYVWIDNSTQILCPSPKGKIWLILCCYDLSPNQIPCEGIFPCIKNNFTGEIMVMSFGERKKRLLSEREKEILSMIKDGKSSKMIADLLKISVHTVSRHRQNIIEKLCVSNTFEAITAARDMLLI